MIPEDLLYTKDHEWVRLDGAVGTVGITHHAQKELGDIVFLELPRPGKQLRAGDEIGTVESVKAVAEIFAPVGGEVIAVNDTLTENPDRSAIVNRDPYGDGWLVRIRLAEPGEADVLLRPDAYRRYLAEGTA